MTKIEINYDENYFKNGSRIFAIRWDDEEYPRYCTNCNEILNIINNNWTMDLRHNAYDNKISFMTIPIKTNGIITTINVNLRNLFMEYINIIRFDTLNVYYDEFYLTKEDFKYIFSKNDYQHDYEDIDEVLNDDIIIKLYKDEYVYANLTVIYKPTMKHSFLRSTSVIEAYTGIKCKDCNTVFTNKRCPNCGGYRE